MNAIQLPKPPRPERHLRVVQPKPRQKPRQIYWAVALETTAKLSVNLVFSVAAIVTLAQLLPYRNSQQAKLQELQTEVKSTSERVDRLQADFNRHFDPTQAKGIMQEQSSRIDPQKRQVFWLQKEEVNPEGVAQSP